MCFFLGCSGFLGNFLVGMRRVLSNGLRYVFFLENLGKKMVRHDG